ncbi:MAG: Stk1 family PASTA domain-containing Ser/Thr kinase [Lachnospiraceae bacterium]
MLAEGTYIADRYELIEDIGHGGMSDVFKAIDHKLERYVAIKILKREFVDDMNFVTKFRTEAQAAASLEHPNIVNIYDVGSENGLHYIVMEYVQGITLKKYIAKKGRLSFKEAVSIAIQVGRGIEAAHNKHIVHQDIKPQNIIISNEGKVKVTDFGIARAATSNTINADVMGSVHYTSPEQARNGYVDGRSDIYSLGIVMYEMVTGRVPFDGDTTVAVAIQHLQDEMVIPSTYAPELPISMEKIILKCTQKSPDRRYQTMTELINDLRQSLLTPDADFVVMIPLNNQEKTRVITEDEVNEINQQANQKRYQDLNAQNHPQKRDLKKSEKDELEEDLEANGILNPKMEKAVTVMGVIAAVIIAGIIIYIIGGALGIFKFGSGKSKEDSNAPVVEEDVSKKEDEEEQVEMIDLTGKTIEEAEEALRGAGYTKMRIKLMGMKESDDFEENQIMQQNPKEGEKVDKDTKIQVTLCGGPNLVEIPSGLEGKTQSDVVAALESVGLKAAVESNYNDTVPEGCVISVSPAGGEKMSKGSSVTVIVSLGVQPLEVPNVTGKSEEEARQEIQNAGFNVGNVSTAYSDSIPAGKVISCDPSGTVPKGTTINLIISNGPEKHSYKIDRSVSSPDDGHNYLTASAVLKDSNGKVLLSKDGIDISSSGSVHVSANGIEGASSGTIQVTWHYKDVEIVYDDEGKGTEQVKEGDTSTTENVTFTEE